jgi:hypothetical protein
MIEYNSASLTRRSIGYDRVPAAKRSVLRPPSSSESRNAANETRNGLLSLPHTVQDDTSSPSKSDKLKGKIVLQAGLRRVLRSSFPVVFLERAQGLKRLPSGRISPCAYKLYEWKSYVATAAVLALGWMGLTLVSRCTRSEPDWSHEQTNNIFRRLQLTPTSATTGAPQENSHQQCSFWPLLLYLTSLWRGGQVGRQEHLPGGPSLPIVFPPGAFPAVSPTQVSTLEHLPSIGTGAFRKSSPLESTRFHVPAAPCTEFLSEGKGREFGLADLWILEEFQQRVIYHDFEGDESPDMHGTARRQRAKEADDNILESYYAFDDDVQRNPYTMYDDDSIAETHRCRRTALHRRNPLNCNPFHELGIADNALKLNFHFLK